ncbi:hypothetical protein Tco_0524307 [Tanacetum coccineum]
MSSARIHCAMLNIPQSTHDLISPFTVEDNDEVGRRSTITSKIGRAPCCDKIDMKKDKDYIKKCGTWIALAQKTGLKEVGDWDCYITNDQTPETETWTKRFKGILRHMNIYIFDPLPKVAHLDNGMITYSGSGAAEVEGYDHHVDFLSELRKAMNH